MSRVLRTDVWVQRDGKPELLAAGSPVPAWAKDLVTNERAFTTVPTADAPKESPQAADGYAALSGDELKALLTGRGLPVSGNKKAQIARLEEHDAAENGDDDEEEQSASYDELDEDALRAALKERELPDEGTREELIERLEEDDAENRGEENQE